MSDCCSKSEGETLVFTCAGAAYSGQVANRAGLELMKEGAGSLFCVAAVGAGIPEKIERTRKAGKRVVLDGCEDHCARKVLQSAGFSVDFHVDVTQLGIDKKPADPHLLTDAKRIVETVKAKLCG